MSGSDQSEQRELNSLAADPQNCALTEVRHSRMLLSLDFPRDGEVLEPSGIQGMLGTGPPIKTFGGQDELAYKLITCFVSISSTIDAAVEGEP